MNTVLCDVLFCDIAHVHIHVNIIRTKTDNLAIASFLYGRWVLVYCSAGIYRNASLCIPHSLNQVRQELCTDPLPFQIETIVDS